MSCARTAHAHIRRSRGRRLMAFESMRGRCPLASSARLRAGASNGTTNITLSKIGGEAASLTPRRQRGVSPVAAAASCSIIKMMLSYLI